MAEFQYVLAHAARVDRDGEALMQGPPSAFGQIKLARNEDRGKAELGFYVLPADAKVGSEMTLLGKGDLREIRPAARLFDAWEAHTGYRPAGPSLADLLWDQLTLGSDPNGDAAPFPLMPTTNGRLSLLLPGHGEVRRVYLKRSDPHWAAVVDRVKQATRQAFEDEEAGLVSAGHKNRVLDWLGRKYQSPDPKSEFIPADLPKWDRQPHETIIQDTFDRANAGTLGTSSSGHTWGQHGTSGTADIVSNEASATAINDHCRLEVSLSQSDMRLQATLTALTRVAGQTHTFGLFSRMASGDANYDGYFGALRKDDGNTTGAAIIQERNGAVNSILSGPTAVSVTAPGVLVFISNGSDHYVYWNGTLITSASDSTHSSEVRGGIRFFGSAASTQPVSADNWQLSSYPSKGRLVNRDSINSLVGSYLVG